jgi:hypothetical protein
MDAALKELNPGRYRRLIELVIGQDCPFALCDSSGSVVWTSDGSEDSGIAIVISILNDQGFNWEFDSRGVLLRDVDESHSLLYQRIDPLVGDAAWLAVLVDRDGAERKRTRLQSSGDGLAVVTACLSEDHRYGWELNDLIQELAQRNEELNLFYSLDDLSGDGQDVARGIAPLLEKIVMYAGVDLAAFVAPRQQTPTYAVSPDADLSSLPLVLIHVGGNLPRFTASTGKTLVINRRDDPRRSFLFAHLPYKVLATPVIDDGDSGGMLALVRREDRPDFTNSDRKIAKIVTHHVGVATRKQRMLHKMQQFGEQMASALIEAVESKDPYTAGHSERVQAIAVHTGHVMGLNRRDLQDLFWGAVLHDIGKIGIPDVILCKPAKLTEDEYAFIKTHPQQSYEILSHIDYVTENALLGVRHHHERFDGTGYPDGLRGGEIPLHSRIISVSDCYDAITSSRSYRSDRNHSAAFAEIRRVTGSQLDPQVVTAFEQVCEGDMMWLDSLRSHHEPRDE